MPDAVTPCLAPRRKHGRSAETDEAEHDQPRSQGSAAAGHRPAAGFAPAGARAQAARGPQPGRGAGRNLPRVGPGLALRACQGAGMTPAAVAQEKRPRDAGPSFVGGRAGQALTAATARATYSRLPWLSAATQMRPVPTA